MKGQVAMGNVIVVAGETTSHLIRNEGCDPMV